MKLGKIFRKRLMTPGPTPVDPGIALSAVNNPVYHRTEEFYTLFLSLRKYLAVLMDCKELPLVLTASGTGAMEAAIGALTSRGDRILVLSAGRFAQRFEEILTRLDRQVTVLNSLWGESFALEEIGKTVKSADFKAVFFQANETSTGVFHPVKEIVQTIRSHSEALVVVDGISALGAHEIRLDSWGIDCLLGSSQKGLGAFAGLSFIGMSKRAIKQMTQGHSYYFDLAAEWKLQAQGYTHFTPAIPTIIQLQGHLEWLLEEVGLETSWTFHKHISAAVRAALISMDLALYPKAHYSHAVSAFHTPAGLNSKQLQALCLDDFNCLFAGGQSNLSGKIIRFAHLGMNDPFDLLSAIGALELGMARLGWPHEPGRGVQSFLSQLNSLDLS